MTQKQLEKEARKLYRRVYDKTVVCGHEYAQREAEKAYGVYITRFQSHVTNPPRVEGIAEAMDNAFKDFFEKQGELSCEPAENPDKLPEFEGPDWSKAPEWANWCAQDKDGAVYWYGKKPQAAIKQWSPMKGDVEFFAECYQPANWETAIWQRPQSNEQ